jgi:hypothetical protein
MSEQPITLSVLMRFHREVFVPDVKRIVGEAVGGLRDEMHTLHDSLLVRFERLENIRARLDAVAAQVTAPRKPQP